MTKIKKGNDEDKEARSGVQHEFYIRCWPYCTHDDNDNGNDNGDENGDGDEDGGHSSYTQRVHKDYHLRS